MDGVNWDVMYTVADGVDCDGPATMLERYYGGLVVYAIDTSGGADLINCCILEEADFANTGWTTEGFVNPNDGNADCNYEELCAREFFNGGFIDIAAMVHDNEGSDFFNVVVYRTGMWSGVQFDDIDWTVVWTAHAYPSATDPDPNLSAWVESQAGTGAVAIGADDGYSHIETACGAGSPNRQQYYDNAIMPADSWDTGLTLRWESKTVSGAAKIYVRMCSDGGHNDKDIAFTIDIGTGTIRIYDELAGATIGTINPTNWAPNDWNDYVLQVIGDDDGTDTYVRLFRAPAAVYKEIQHYELVFDTLTGLQENAYPLADNDIVRWGVNVDDGFTTAASEAHWRSFMLCDELAFDIDWKDDWQDLTTGKRCHNSPVGLLQGIECAWDGEFAVDGETWDLDVGAHFDADNVFVDSPRVYYSEPEHTGACGHDRVIEFRRHEGDESTCMNLYFNSIAVFGLNTPYIAIEGADFAGSSYDWLWCNRWADQGGGFVYDSTLQSTLVFGGNPDQNVLRFSAGTSNMDMDLIPNQFASTEFRRWYIILTSGGQSGRIYRIDGNDETRLFLECNIEADGVTHPVNFSIFSDRFFHMLNSAYTYPRIRITIWGTTMGVRPSPSEESLRLGTIVLGNLVDLPDDAWESSIRTDPGVEVMEGRGRISQLREAAPERRMIDLRYTGRTDKGMGVEISRELFRHARWGVHPVVWIDDDTALTPSGGACSIGAPSTMSHTDPILARVRGPINQQRRMYSYLQQDGSYHVRSVHDVNGVTLEEVL
jgi:hypothetical protein